MKNDNLSVTLHYRKDSPQTVFRFDEKGNN